MGALIRAMDWTGSPLGPPDDWPQSLRTAVGIMLSSRYAMFVWWGRQLVNLYNDAYRPFLGAKHPQALGRSAREVWGEIWDLIGPRTEAVLERGESTFDEALLLVMERFGYPEETYFTFSYSPIRNDRGDVGGIFCAVTDETQRVIGERQLALLRELAAGMADARSIGEACERGARALATNPRDLPFALIYLVDAEHRRARLAGASGIVWGTPTAPLEIPLDKDAPWRLDEVIGGAGTRLVDLEAMSLPLPAGTWDRPPVQAAMLPIAPQGQTGQAGVLIAGLNPYRLFDAGYQRLLDLVAGQLAAAIANSHAHEEERRRAEALAEIDRAKTAFFSNVSHEFRTPLTLMLGPLEEALAAPAEALPQRRGDLALVHRNGLRLLRLVNTLLDFSRIEAGRVQASYEPVELAGFTAELASVFRAATEKAGLTLTVDCPPLAEPVWIDRDMWEKIVLNLISNAFKFTLEGGIAVRLRKENAAAVLAVEDTGTGIPADELPRLFDRFHRVEGARGRTHEGTGIGLALVQELVKLHGGTVGAESELGQGSIFTVTIPLGAAHLPADRLKAERTLVSTALGAKPYVEEALRWLPGAAPGLAEEVERELLAEQPPVASAAQRATILLADDNADMRDYVRRLLTPIYEVKTAADGEAALAALHEGRPDLVLSDVMMPGLDGFGLLRQIRADAKLADLPVILLSARAGEEASIEGLDAGADDYLVKPFSARELLARIRTNLEMARTRRAADEALRQAYRETTDILESIDDAFFAVDGEWRFTYVNRRAEELWGRRREELAARSIWDAFPDAIGTPIHDAMKRAMRERRTITCEAPSVVTGGWLRCAFYPSHAGISAYLRDITEQKQAEAVLRDSEERFRVLAESLPSLIFVADGDGQNIYTNPHFQRYTGLAAEDLLGTGWLRAVHPDDRARAEARWEESWRSGSPYQAEYRFRDAAGGYRWHLVRGNPVRDVQSRIVQWVGSGIDIEELRESENRLRATIQAAPFPMMLHAEDGEIIELSRKWTELSGYSREELRTHFDWVRLAYPDAVEENIKRIAAEFDQEGYSVTGPLSIRAKNGVARLWDFYNVRIGRLPGGRRLQVCAANDITDRRRAEEAVLKAQAQLLTIFENTPLGVYLVDGNFRIRAVNPVARPVFGEIPQLIGRDFSEVMHILWPAGYADEVVARFRRTLETGEPHIVPEHVEERLDRGVKEYYEWQIHRVPLPEERYGVVCYFRDISAQVLARQEIAAAATRLRELNESLERKVEERSRALENEMAERQKIEAVLHQAQRLEAIGQLTGGVAHDFNNLLTVIVGQAEAITIAAEDNQRVTRMAAAALRAAERGAELTNQLLSFSGRQQLRPVTLAVDQLIRNVGELTRRTIGEAISVEISLDPALWPSHLDPAQFESAILNLAINARDAMPEGGRLVIDGRNATLGADEAKRLGLAPGDYVLVGVTDDGLGMTAEVQRRAFEPFFTTKDIGKGTGLGLSQIYGFVRQSGGTATIESAPSKGTTVTLYLPRAMGAVVKEPSPRHQQRLRSGEGRTVLVVEDQADVREIVETTLNDLGYRVLTATDGVKARRVLESNEAIDLLLTDVVMPNGVSGLDLAQEARRLRQDLKIIVVSGYFREAQNRRIDVPGIIFLEKPFLQTELADTVAAALGDKASGVGSR